MSKPEAPADRPIDTRTVRDLAKILKETGLTEIEVEQGDLKIRVSRAASPAAAPMAYYAAPEAAAAPVAASAPTAAAPVAPAAVVGEVVKSPMVGTVYLSPAPGSNAFVKVGDTVTAGQTLLIIEAMKTMNPIPSPKAGKVVEILAADATPVEFGEGLVIID